MKSYYPPMLTPAPTTVIDPRLARGVYEGEVPATETKAGMICISVPNTTYQIHLVASGAVDGEVGKRIVGTIRARARRIDEVKTGGKFVEPVMGRPRRVQGRIVAVEGDAVVVDAGVPIHCVPTDARQKAEQFKVGQFVGFDVLEGATFERRK
jgi:hypothetical protein